MFRSSNPALRTDYFRDLAGTASGDQAMTVNGTANKTGLMLLILITGATLTWTGNPATIGGWAMLGGIGGFIAALVTIFKKEYARYSAPVYAFLEGLFLGAISSVFEAQYPGIVQQAVLLTFGTAGAMLLAYRSGMIKVTEKFKLGVFAATGGIAMAYFLGWIMSFFGANVSILWGGGGMFGILFNLFVVGVAALNLVMDFDFIEEAAEYGAPKYMEWYGAFGLMVTLVWLYIEFLRLLSRLQRR